MSTDERRTISGMLRMRLFHRVAASVALVVVPACNGGDLVLPADSAPSAMTIVEGDEQTGSVGAPLPDSLVVRVTDDQARAVAGLSVVFDAAVQESGGDVVPDTALTGADGEAWTRWVLGPSAGAQAVEARVIGQPLRVTFTAAAEAASAHAIEALSGGGQSAPVGTPLPDSLVARVTDRFGNPVAGAEVRWSVESGSVSPATSATGDDGRAATRRVLGSSIGTQTTSASSRELEGSPVTFTHIAIPGTAASLVLISGNDQSALAGTELPNALVVRLVDQAGNGIPDQAVSWVVPSGNGTASPETSNTDSDGFTSTRWTLNTTPGPNRLTAVVSGVGVVEFVATGTGGGGDPVAHHLVFRVQPSDVEEDENIEPAVEVAVVDQNGILVPESGIEIRLELVPDDGRLRGDRTRDTEDGVAVFDNLEVQRDGEDFRLRASAQDFPGLGEVESESFDVSDD